MSELLFVMVLNSKEAGGGRSIFIDESGLVRILMEYHKGQNIAQTRKYISRYLHDKVGRPLVRSL